MSIKMRFRTDGWHWADMKAQGITVEQFVNDWHYSQEQAVEYAALPIGQPGDVWRINWHGGPIAGYAICCLTCKHVHSWTTAVHCNPRIQHSYKDKDGKDVFFSVCTHSGKSSCWNWSGSAEDCTLTATPSLHCDKALGGCGYHGFLTNGILSGL